MLTLASVPLSDGEEGGPSHPPRESDENKALMNTQTQMAVASLGINLAMKWPKLKWRLVDRFLHSWERDSAAQLIKESFTENGVSLSFNQGPHYTLLSWSFTIRPCAHEVCWWWRSIIPWIRLTGGSCGELTDHMVIISHWNLLAVIFLAYHSLQSNPLTILVII